MKKLLVVLLSLGLILAFGMTASAQTGVKFSGQYYVNGVYEDNRAFKGDNAYSRAFMWNRTRVQMVFNVAEGLTFTTRFDAFEKLWGAVNRSSSTTEDKSNSGRVNSTTLKNQENIEMEQGYVTFMTAIGKFDVGYQAADEWGTVFADMPGSRPRAKYTGAFGPFNLIAIFEKVYEADTTMYTPTPSGLSSADSDNYMLAGIFNFKGGSAGLLYKYADHQRERPTANRKTQIHAFVPYMKGTFGPVYVEAEVVYLTGKTYKYESPSTTADMDKEGLGAYALARVNLGPAYVGGQFGYSSGDPNSTTKDKSGPVSTTSWRPCLIFGEANLRVWASDSHLGTGTAGGQYSTDKQNLWLYNIFGGFNLTPKFNIEAALSYMHADNAPAGYVSKDYGTEADIKATYKIYDNLSYMVGAGYLWTGNYFKGKSDANKIGNDYLVMNQLTLNF